MKKIFLLILLTSVILSKHSLILPMEHSEEIQSEEEQSLSEMEEENYEKFLAEHKEDILPVYIFLYSILTIGGETEQLEEVLELLDFYGIDFSLSPLQIFGPETLTFDNLKKILPADIPDIELKKLVIFQKYSPLELAYDLNRIKMIMQYGANINRQDEQGDTILHTILKRINRYKNLIKKVERKLTQNKPILPNRLSRYFHEKPIYDQDLNKVAYLCSHFDVNLNINNNAGETIMNLAQNNEQVLNILTNCQKEKLAKNAGTI